MTPMEIYCSKASVVCQCAVSVGLFTLAVLGSNPVAAFVGGVMGVLGVLLMVHPVVRIESNEIQVRNLLGITVNRFPVSSPSDLCFVGNALWHVPSGKKILRTVFGMDSAQVAALRSQIPHWTR